MEVSNQLDNQDHVLIHMISLVSDHLWYKPEKKQWGRARNDAWLGGDDVTYQETHLFIPHVGTIFYTAV